MNKEEHLTKLNLRILELEGALKAANGEYQSAARKAREKHLAVRQIKARLLEVENVIYMLNSLGQELLRGKSIQPTRSRDEPR